MNEIDKNSTQYFRAVEPLLDRNGTTWAATLSDDSHTSIYVGSPFTVAEARALRDWLDKALPLPCEHKHATPLGYGHGGYKCLDCGATLP